MSSSQRPLAGWSPAYFGFRIAVIPFVECIMALPRPSRVRSPFGGVIDMIRHRMLGVTNDASTQHLSSRDGRMRQHAMIAERQTQVWDWLLVIMADVQPTLKSNGSTVGRFDLQRGH